MQAIVIKNENGIVTARVRRNYRNEQIQGRHDDLRAGDRVEVVRKVNNPYLVRV
jgi:hypothetical protein